MVDHKVKLIILSVCYFVIIQIVKKIYNEYSQYNGEDYA